MGNPADVVLVGDGRGSREQFERHFFDSGQAIGAQGLSPQWRELEQFMQPRHRLRVRGDRRRDVFDVFDDRLAEPRALPEVTMRAICCATLGSILTFPPMLREPAIWALQ